MPFGRRTRLSLTFGISVAVHENKPTPEPLPPWKQFLAISGADFEGLMIAARLSIGLALFHRDGATGRSPAIDNFLQLHLMGATVALGSASDRIRDLFIATAFHQKTKAYGLERPGESKQAKKLRGSYRGPFDDALFRFGNRPDLNPMVIASLEALPSTAEQVQEHRDTRNEIVHEIATEMGQRERWLIEQPAETEQASEMEAVAGPIGWYKLLMTLSNHVFIAHNQLGKLQSAD